MNFYSLTYANFVVHPSQIQQFSLTLRLVQIVGADQLFLRSIGDMI